MNEIIENYFSGQHSSDDVLTLPIKIQQGQNNILEVIENLGIYLTSTDVEKRVKSCEFLAEVLQGLKNDIFTEKEILTLSEFFCARLQDHYTLQPSVLQSLVVISKASNLSGNTVKIVIEAIFKEVHIQSCLQNDRYKIFQILSNFFEAHKSVIFSMKKDFLCKYIEAIDSEQDPRNLMIIFQLSADLIENGLQFYNLEEEFFDVTSCYFPIDFNPSASGKKTTITNSSLVVSLRRVLSSTNKFSNFCIPLLLEKLESEVETAKLDSILTFISCLKLYGKADLVKFLPTILTTLRQEIVNSVSEKIETEALNLLTKLIENISSWPVDQSQSNLNSFLSEILEEIIERIKEPIQDKLTWVSVLIMLACAKGSKSACEITVNAVMPVFLLQSLKNSDGNATLNLQNLDNIVKLMAITGEFNFSIEENPFFGHKDTILVHFKSILESDVSIPRQCAVIAGYTAFLRLQILSDQDLQELASCFLDILLKNKENTKLRSEVLSASGYFSSKYPETVTNSMIPSLKNLINENEINLSVKEDFKNALECFVALSTNETLQKDVAHYMMALLEKCEINEQNNFFILEILNCLNSITENCKENDDGLILCVAIPLMKLNIKFTVNIQPDKCCACCTKNKSFTEECVSIPIIKLSASVVKNLCQKLTKNEVSESLVKFISDLYLENDTTSLNSQAGIKFLPFDCEFSVLQTRTVCLLAASICNFQNQIPIPNVKDFREKLLQLCLKSNDQLTYVSASKTLSGLINKFSFTSDDILNEILEVAHSPTPSKMNLITLIIWTTKALTLCNHPKTFDFVQIIFSMFEHEEVADVAAAGFDIILRESDEVLCSRSHAVIRLMFKQRFFLLIFPKLVRGFHESDNGQFYLTSLSHLLVHLPKQVLFQEFPELMPLLVESMSCQDPSMLLSVLSALYCLIQEASGSMESYIETLLEGFLKLTTFKNSLKVRLKAIMCVGACTLLPSHIILPMKQPTIKGLKSALDDHKRDVRVATARARSEWFLVGV